MSAPKTAGADGAQTDPVGDLLRGLTREQLVSVIRRSVWFIPDLADAVQAAKREALDARHKADSTAQTAAAEAWRAAGDRARAPGATIADQIAYWEAFQAYEATVARERRSFDRLMASYDD